MWVLPGISAAGAGIPPRALFPAVCSSSLRGDWKSKTRPRAQYSSSAPSTSTSFFPPHCSQSCFLCLARVCPVGMGQIGRGSRPGAQIRAWCASPHARSPNLRRWLLWPAPVPGLLLCAQHPAQASEPTARPLELCQLRQLEPGRIKVLIACDN